MTFGKALEALKEGFKVARRGWNGKGMWIALTPGSEIHPGLARSGACKMLAEQKARECSIHPGDEERITIGAHIDMKSADGSIVVGWLASQTDMLAEDWVLVD